MGKTPAAKKTTTLEQSAQQVFSAMDARSQFFAATLGMGWRLAITVLVPLLAGIKLDKHYHTEPSYTLVGFMIAITGAAIVVWHAIQDVNQAQQEKMDKKEGDK